jgi:hypothetical protein
MRAELTGGGVNDLKFFFDTDGKAVSHGMALRLAWASLGTSKPYHTLPTEKLPHISFLNLA